MAFNPTGSPFVSGVAGGRSTPMQTPAQRAGVPRPVAPPAGSPLANAGGPPELRGIQQARTQAAPQALENSVGLNKAMPGAPAGALPTGDGIAARLASQAAMVPAAAAPQMAGLDEVMKRMQAFGTGMPGASQAMPNSPLFSFLA